MAKKFTLFIKINVVHSLLLLVVNNSTVKENVLAVNLIGIKKQDIIHVNH